MRGRIGRPDDDAVWSEPAWLLGRAMAGTLLRIRLSFYFSWEDFWRWPWVTGPALFG